ncbi:RASL12 (predicted) [Pycnogonum litorale]
MEQASTSSEENKSNVPKFKIAVVGDHGVGKSALTVKYLTKRFISEYDPTLEDTYSKYDVVMQQNVFVTLMDTYDDGTKNPTRFLDWADGFIVVYAVNQRSTFERAQQILEKISQRRKNVINSSVIEAPCILVGNKSDLARYRQVSKVEGHDLSSQYDATFVEATATKEFQTVSRIFNTVVEGIINERELKKTLKPLYIVEDRTYRTTEQ